MPKIPSKQSLIYYIGYVKPERSVRSYIPPSIHIGGSFVWQDAEKMLPMPRFEPKTTVIQYQYATTVLQTPIEELKGPTLRGHYGTFKPNAKYQKYQTVAFGKHCVC
jgi:hypothetical protein